MQYGRPRLIKELGLRYPTQNSLRKCQYGLYECQHCMGNYESICANVNTSKSTRCVDCKKNGDRGTHGATGTQLYVVWKNIRQRVLNSKHPRFKDYGGRGITLCKSWTNSFEEFRDWSMQNGYENALTLDRENNDQGYSPDNCRWVSQTVQLSNTRVSVLNRFSVDELSEIAEMFYAFDMGKKVFGKLVGLSESSIIKLLNGGYSKCQMV